MARLKMTAILSLLSTIVFEKYVHGVDPKGKAPMGSDSSGYHSKRSESDLSQSNCVDNVHEKRRKVQSDASCDEYGYPNLNEAELYKQGCTLAENGEHQEAYECFSNVITMNPNVPKYFYNRALCAIRLERFDKAVEDCEKALRLDPWSVKANFFLGSAYLQLDDYNEAVFYLYRAYDSAKEQRQSFGDDIASQLRLARRLKWRSHEDERLAQENKLGLFPYLKILLKEARDEEIENVTAAGGSRQTDEQRLEQQNEEIRKIERKFQGYTADVTNILSKAEEKTKRRELPDYLSGRMSYKILDQNATITPTGDTFEKEVLLDHFRRFGNFDPLHPDTPLDESMLVSNLAMNYAAEAFVKENDWLEEFENYVFDFDNDGDRMDI